MRILEKKDQYKVVNCLPFDKWSEFIYEHKQGNIFQTPEMFSVYMKTKNYHPILFAVLDKNEEIVAVLVTVIIKHSNGMSGYFSSRSIIWGGPIVKDNNLQVLNFLLSVYNKYISKYSIYTEIRNLWDQSDNINTFNNINFLYEDHLDILVDLDKSEDILWSELHSKRRNEIRRSKKEGVQFRVVRNDQEILDVYNILSHVYRNAKLPFPDRSLFDSSKEILYPKSMIQYFVAVYNNKIIGTLISLNYKDTVYDWYAGSYREYYNKYPNDLIPWEVFRWSKKRGFKVFDFGGAGKPGVPYGVRDYKKKFGGEFVNYGRFIKVHKPLIYNISKIGFYFWQRFRH